jgi:hypothetical protein
MLTTFEATDIVLCDMKFSKKENVYVIREKDDKHVRVYLCDTGVQFFGDLHNHCVRECVENANDVTINDLTIPDTYCKQEREDSYGYDCPR